MAGSNRPPANTNVPPAWARPDLAAQGRTAPAHEQDDPMMQWATQGHQRQPQHLPVAHRAPAHPAPMPPGYGEPFAYQQPPAAYAQQDAPQHAGHGRPEWPTAGYDQQPAVQGYAAHPQHYDQHQQGYPAANGYPAAHQGYDAPAPEAQNWDLRQFSQQQVHDQQQAYAQPPQAAAYQEPQGYGYQSPHGQHPAQDPRYAQQWQELQQGREPTYNLDQYAQQQPGQPTYTDDQPQDYAAETDGLDEIPEEPERRRGPRAALVAGALVGAIAVGGGLAYGYRMLGGGKDGGKPPVVRADKAPAKVKPADSGGKDVAHTDKKFLNRLTEDGKSAATAAAVPTGLAPQPAPIATAPNEPEQPKKVTTLVVNRDGTLTPQLNPLPQPPTPAPRRPAWSLTRHVLRCAERRAKRRLPRSPICRFRGFARQSLRQRKPTRPQSRRRHRQRRKWRCVMTLRHLRSKQRLQAPRSLRAKAMVPSLAMFRS